MKITILLVTLCFHWRSSVADEAQNKTKRGLLEQTHYLTSFRPINVYPDPATASTQPQGLSNYYTPKAPPKAVYEPEPPKVTAQQVLYEYQQTPTNTVSNVHFNQHIIPQEQQQQVAYSQYLPNTQYPQVANQGQFTPSETVVTPVQHSAIIQHAPYIHNAAQVAPTNPNPYIPGKYLYLNGKVMYHATPQLQHPLQRPLQQKLPYQKLTPPAAASPVSYQNYQLLPKTLPSVPPKQVVKQQEVKKVVEVEDDDEEERSNVRDDDEEERENYREDDDEEEEDRPRYKNKDDDEEYERYSFDEDDDEDHERYKEDDDEDEDNHRGSTKYYEKKAPKRYHSSYKYKEGYKTKSNSHKPYKSHKNPKSYKSQKSSAKSPTGKKVDLIQGKQSQHVPVTVQKVYREKWFITRNSNPDQ